MNANDLGLMPCPFCGEKESITLVNERELFDQLVYEATDDSWALESYEDQISENVYGYRVQCRVCFSYGRWRSTDTEAIKHWNRRAPMIRSIVFKHSGREIITDNMIDINKG